MRVVDFSNRILKDDPRPLDETKKTLLNTLNVKLDGGWIEEGKYIPCGIWVDYKDSYIIEKEY